MTRLDQTFRDLRARGQLAFVPFMVLGDPDYDTSLQILERLCDAGADVLELGIPFSDPPADGPVIQAAGVRALRAGMRVSRCLELVAELHRRRPDVPVSLLTYLNPLEQYGLQRFYRDAAAAGVDGVLVADLPLEEAMPAIEAAREAGVAPVLIASELTPDDRLTLLAALGEGYVYAVARIGITGEQTDLASGLAATFARFKASISLPIVAGFGLSTPDHLRDVFLAGADGAIVGSALVRRLEAALPDRLAVVEAVAELAAELAAAAHAVHAPTGARPC
jgi:tryptophan synthase alpha chain